MPRKVILTDFSQLEHRIAAQDGTPIGAQGTGRQMSEPEYQHLPVDPLARSAWADIAAAMPRYAKTGGNGADGK